MLTVQLRRPAKVLAVLAISMMVGIGAAHALPIKSMNVSFDGGLGAGSASLSFNFDQATEADDTVHDFSLSALSWTDVFGNPLGLSDVSLFRARIDSNLVLQAFLLEIDRDFSGHGDGAKHLFQKAQLGGQPSDLFMGFAVTCVNGPCTENGTDFLSDNGNGNGIGGAGDRVAGTNTFVRGLSTRVGTVPEPASLALLGLGLLGIAGRRQTRVI